MSFLIFDLIQIYGDRVPIENQIDEWPYGTVSDRKMDRPRFNPSRKP